MKSCPTCNRTFEDTFTFCLIDGSILSAPFDPAAQKERPLSRDAAPPPTEVISAAPELPPTPAATPRDLQSTIAAPFMQQPQQLLAQPLAAVATSETRSLPEIDRWMFILRGGIAILFGILLLLWRGSPSRDAIPIFALVVCSVITGICTIFAGAKLQSSYKRGWLLITSGVLRVIFVFPFGILVLMMIVAGAIEIAAAIRLRKHITGAIFLELAGIVSMLFFPALLFVNTMLPFATRNALTFTFGGLTIVFGACSVAFGLTMRSSRREVS